MTAMLASLAPFAAWTPDHWIALTQHALWPAVTLLLAAAFYRRVEDLLTALAGLIDRTRRLSIFGVELETVEPQQIGSIRPAQVRFRFTSLHAPDPPRPRRPQVVRERLIRFPDLDDRDDRDLPTAPPPAPPP